MSALHNLKLLIDLLFQVPRRTNAEIARLVGSGRRRVRRYRLLLSVSKLTARDLAGCDALMLNALFNSRSPSIKYTVPDFDALEVAHPGRSGRFHWKSYCAASGDARTLSYAQFMRCRAACAWTAIAARQRSQHIGALGHRCVVANQNARAQEARP